MNTKRIFVRDLTPGSVFTLPGIGTVYVATAVRTGGGTTLVQYRVSGGGYSGEFHKPGMSSVDVIL